MAHVGHGALIGRGTYTAGRCHSRMSLVNLFFLSSGTRVFVQDTIYDEFVKLSVERALKRPVGSPWDMSVDQGPQVSTLPTSIINFIFL